MRIKSLLPALLLAIFICPITAFSANTKGVIGFPVDKDAPMTVSMKGNFMNLDGKFWSGTGGLGGGEHIHAEFTVKNLSKATTFYSIHVAFFDKKWNLIASDGFTQVFGQDPGKTDKHGADLYIPQSELGKVAIYQVTFYDDAAGIGKQ